MKSAYLDAIFPTRLPHYPPGSNAMRRGRHALTLGCVGCEDIYVSVLLLDQGKRDIESALFGFVWLFYQCLELQPRGSLVCVARMVRTDLVAVCESRLNTMQSMRVVGIDFGVDGGQPE